MNCRRYTLPILALLLLSLFGCSSANRSAVPDKAKPPALPQAVGGGMGSEHGNYASVEAGEITRDGVRCTVYVWDRPLTNTLALRVRSATCPVKDVAWMKSVEIDRTVIPIADSEALKSEQ